MSTPLYLTARAAYGAGICVVPPREDGSKRPLTEKATIDGETKDTWRHWAIERPSKEEMGQWYGDGSDPTDCTLRTGIGYLGGAISGGLTLFETDEADLYEQVKEAARSCRLGPLLQRVEDGYLEVSPGGGKRVLYRCPEGIMGNNKLAQRTKRPEEMKGVGDKVKTIIETRGEGGYMIVAPSNGRVHPSGGQYRLLKGGVSSIVTITPEEQADLWELARAFDEMPDTRTEDAGHTTGSTPRAEGGRPGDDFNSRATWEDTGLYDAGWQRAYARGGITYLRRPGKRKGISASLDYKGAGYLYVFSTSTDFEAARGYSKFAVYTILKYSGDFKAATKELAAKGYGTHNNSSAGTTGPSAERKMEEPASGAHTTAGGLIRLSDVQPERVSWLWQQRIPLGKLTLLDGDPGLGKTTIALDLAARVSTGAEMPDGTWGDLEAPAGVLLLSAEDGLADTIRPRLDAAGADCSRVVARQTLLDSSGVIRMPSLADLAQMEMDIAVVGARMLIIDPVMAYLPETVKSHVDADVRRVLAPLAELAERTGVAIVVLRHLNKAAGGNPLYRGGGSIAFIGAVRSGLLAAKDPDDETGDKFVLAPLKANLGKKAQPLAYHIEGLENGASRIVWDGLSQYNADELLSNYDPEERGALADAVTWLADFLDQGPCRAADVHKAADAARIAQRTLRRAKDRLKVRAERMGAITDGYWEWSLPRE